MMELAYDEGGSSWWPLSTLVLGRVYASKDVRRHQEKGVADPSSPQGHHQDDRCWAFCSPASPAACEASRKSSPQSPGR